MNLSFFLVCAFVSLPLLVMESGASDVFSRMHLATPYTSDGSAFHFVELPIGISPEQLKSWHFKKGFP